MTWHVDDMACLYSTQCPLHVFREDASHHLGNTYKCTDYLTRIKNSTLTNTATKLRTLIHCHATSSDVFETDIANNEAWTRRYRHLIRHCKNESLTEPRNKLLKVISYMFKAHPETITLVILKCSFQNVTQQSLQNINKALHNLYLHKEKLWHQ